MVAADLDTGLQHRLAGVRRVQSMTVRVDEVAGRVVGPVRQEDRRRPGPAKRGNELSPSGHPDGPGRESARDRRPGLRRVFSGGCSRRQGAGPGARACRRDRDDDETERSDPTTSAPQRVSACARHPADTVPREEIAPPGEGVSGGGKEYPSKGLGISLPAD